MRQGGRDAPCDERQNREAMRCVAKLWHAIINMAVSRWLTIFSTQTLRGVELINVVFPLRRSECSTSPRNGEACMAAICADNTANEVIGECCSTCSSRATMTAERMKIYCMKLRRKSTDWQVCLEADANIICCMRGPETTSFQAPQKGWKCSRWSDVGRTRCISWMRA